MWNYFAYTSIRSGKRESEVIFNMDKSLAQQKILNSFRDHFLAVKMEKNYSRESFNIDKKDPDGTLFIDILMNRDKRHRKLDNIIQYVSDNKFKEFVIVIQNIHVLGNVEQIKNYYREFKKHNIYVLCFDNFRLSGISEYSTSDFGFRRRKDIKEYDRAYNLIEQLDANEKLADSRGVLSQFSESFKESYWQYEKYQIPESIAIEASGLKRTPFHRKCALYEYSYDFQSTVGRMDKEELKNLIELPKRFSKFPERFKELEQKIDPAWDDDLLYEHFENMDSIDKLIDDACIELHIPSVHPVNYKRLKLRQEKGRKGIIASYNYNEDIIKKFEEYSLNTENKKQNFWRKYKKNEI